MKLSRMKLVSAAAFALVIGVTALVLMTPATPAGSGQGQFCGGVAEVPCPAGFVCVPVQGCDPLIDACPGRCRRSR